MELPGDMMIEILSRLPVKSLMRFKSVCKAWPVLFRCQHFIAKHHHYQTLNSNSNSNSNPTFIVKHSTRHNDGLSLLSLTIGDAGFLSTVVVDTMFAQFPEQFTADTIIAGSVNGVLCLYDNKDGNVLIALWNPSTAECKSIPLATINPLVGSIKGLTNVGFGFDKETNDYKILIFMCKYTRRRGDVDGKEEVLLYSMKNDSWKKIDSVDVIIKDERSLFNPYIDGVRYWWAERRGRSNEAWVLSFNFVDEVFKQLPLPDFGVSMVGHENYQLAIMNEKISVLNYLEESEGAPTTFIAIWSMTEPEQGVGETWKVKWKEVKKPLYSAILYACSIAAFFGDGANLVLFETKTQKVRDLPLHGTTTHLPQAANFRHSLVHGTTTRLPQVANFRHSLVHATTTCLPQVVNFRHSLVSLCGKKEEDGPKSFYSTPRGLHRQSVVKKMRIS